MKILFFSDTHFGLKSAGFDRTEEIDTVVNAIVDYAIRKEVDLVIHGGDLTHTANPSSEVHSLLVKLFHRLEDNRIKSVFMLGNHDCIHREGCPFGSLAPLEKLNLDYVKSVCITGHERFDDCNILFFPYMSRSNLAGIPTLNDYNEEYLGMLEDSIKEWDEPILAFTHLNIDGADIGNDFILRPVNAVIPERLFEMVDAVFAGHIHLPQEIERKGKPDLYVVGSPISTDFGDAEKKSHYLIQVDADGWLDVERVNTLHTPLVELVYDLVDIEGAIDFDIPIAEINGAGVKVKLRCTEDQRAIFNLDNLEHELLIHAAFVRPIVPTIVRRGTKQKAIISETMTDKEACIAWIEEKQPTHKEEVLNCALDALEETGD